MYTGSTNGQIVRIDPESETVTKIVQIGDEKDENLCSKCIELKVKWQTLVFEEKNLNQISRILGDKCLYFLNNQTQPTINRSLVIYKQQ